MNIKEDCFAYNHDKCDCEALTDLYCKKEQCRFYQNKEDYIQKERELIKQHPEILIKRQSSYGYKSKIK